MTSQQWPGDSIFENFTIFKETYKVVESHEIQAAILLPKDLEAGSHPIVVHIHGGWFMYGHSLFSPFFGPWELDLAAKHDAIIVSADYRLLPTERGITDILEDLEDFWQWMHSALPGVLLRHAPAHSIDFSRLLLAGGSAGGYGAVQLALSHPDDIAAMALQYPFVDPQDERWAHGPAHDATTIFRFPREEILPREVVEAWVEQHRRTVRTEAGLELTPYAVALTQHGVFNSLVFDPQNLQSPEFAPLERIRAGARLPKKIWLLHGEEDSVVSIQTSHRFVALVMKMLPETEIRFDTAPGQEHGFDLTDSSWESFAVGSLDFTKKYWLREW